MMGNMELTREDLRAAMTSRRVANERYRQMLALARAQGMSNTTIAKAVGLSEAAIRLYFVRNPQLMTEELVS